jgi:hypothetical protein
MKHLRLRTLTTLVSTLALGVGIMGAGTAMADGHLPLD